MMQRVSAPETKNMLFCHRLCAISIHSSDTTCAGRREEFRAGCVIIGLIMKDCSRL